MGDLRIIGEFSLALQPSADGYGDGTEWPKQFFERQAGIAEKHATWQPLTLAPPHSTPHSPLSTPPFRDAHALLGKHVVPRPFVDLPSCRTPNVGRKSREVLLAVNVGPMSPRFLWLEGCLNFVGR